MPSTQSWLTGDQPWSLDAYVLTLLSRGNCADTGPATLPEMRHDVVHFAQNPTVAAVIPGERIDLGTHPPTAG